MTGVQTCALPISVYSITSFVGNPLVVTRNELRNKVLFKAQAADMNRIAMEKNGRQYFAAKKIGMNTWEITYPIKVEADMEAISNIINSIEHSGIVSIIDSNAVNLAKYGLNKPSYSIEIETSDFVKKLLIGDEKEKNVEIFAMFEGTNEVFTIGAGSFAFLDKPLAEISERFVYLKDIRDVNEVTVEIGRASCRERV